VTTIETAARIAVLAIAAVVVLAAFDVAESILAPVTVALTAGVVLSPVSDGLERLRIPPVFGALISVFIALAILVGLGLLLYPVVLRLVEEAPKVWADVQDLVWALRRMMDGVEQISEDVSQAIGSAGNGQPAAAPAETAAEAAVPTLGDAILLAPSIAAQLLVFVGALFFFLLTRKGIYEWVALRLAPADERALVARRLKEAERSVARYFLAITLINAGLGAATGIALQLLGLPGGITWGLLAFALNYILYLGPTVLIVSLGFAGIAAFDGTMAALPALTYMILNGIEAQFVTPTVVGRRLSVNPLVLFLALVLGVWLWGPLGGIVAIPLLLWVLVLSDALPRPAAPAAAAKPAPAAE
jgi:predicted PurR-regulated permease PerM